MNIAVIYGNERKGSTYHVVGLLLERLKAETASLTEFFLPRDMNKFCVGCSNCFTKGERFCPHADQVEPIRSAIERADLVIFTSPVYAMRVTAQMKALLDHLAFQFMVHRPNPTMFRKTALIVSTTAGGGIKGAMDDIDISLRFWGVGRRFRLGMKVFASSWDGVTDKKKQQIAQKVDAMVGRIRASVQRGQPSFGGKRFFDFFRLFHKRFKIGEVDAQYWVDQGWMGKQRPWKKT